MLNLRSVAYNRQQNIEDTPLQRWFAKEPQRSTMICNQLFPNPRKLQRPVRVNHQIHCSLCLDGEHSNFILYIHKLTL